MDEYDRAFWSVVKSGLILTAVALGLPALILLYIVFFAPPQ